MLEISSLLNTFSSKVTEQHKEIEHLHDTAVATTDNLVAANQQLQSAKDHNTASRIYILVFFVLAGLSLLFLDWFQP